MTTKEKDELLDVFRNMTLLELSDFIRAFEEEFGVTAAAPVAVTGVTPAEAPAEEAEEQQEFDVILEAVGDKKIQVIKEVRVITKLGLKDAKDLVEKAPVTLLEKADKIVAEQAVKSLADSGATVKLV